MAKLGRTKYPDEAMRVLIGTLSYKPNISGVAISVELLTRHLVESGHEVFIVAPSRRLRSYTEVDPSTGVKVYRVRSIPNPARRNYFLPIFTGGVTERIFQEVKPDIIHVHDPMAMSRYLYRSGKKHGVPTVVSNHFMFDYIAAYGRWLPKFVMNWILANLRRKFLGFYNRCEVVITPSQTVVDYLRGLGVHRPMFALTNGVDIERFFAYLPLDHVRTAYHLPPRPLILYLGRLDSDKSIDVLIKAYAELPADLAHLVLVGSGDKRRQLGQLIKELGLTNRVTFTGPIPHHSLDLVALYQAATVFVMPSSIETQSVTTLEALAAGRPVIAANGGALPELIIDGQNGVMFEAGNSLDLAAKITTVIGDQSLQARLSNGAVATAAEHELERSLAKFVELYQATIDRYQTTK